MSASKPPIHTPTRPERPKIPLTVLVHLYRLLKVMSHHERLEMAKWLMEHPEILDEWFKRSVKRFSTYSNVCEALTGKQTELEPASRITEIRNTVQLVTKLADLPEARKWIVAGNADLSFRYVAREVVASRMTGGARFEDGSPSTGAMKADLLLVNVDGTPIVCEAKVSTEVGNDKDPFFALLQGLTLAALLSTPRQRERLEKHYPEARFGGDGRVDVFVLLYKPKLEANSTYQVCLYDAARRLAGAAAPQASLAKSVRRIAFVEARLDEAGQLVLKDSTTPPGLAS